VRLRVQILFMPRHFPRGEAWQGLFLSTNAGTADLGFFKN